MYNLEKFEKGLEELHIELDQKQFDSFIQYYELLIEWNKVINLTAITEFNEVIQKHFLDSLSLIKVCDLKEKKKIIDLGTGAGFPGIPLKIAFPSLEILLVDSLNKRVKFLNTVIESLNLNEITAIHGRAEELGRDRQYREQFDLCVSRAVANLSTLSEYCIPFVKKGGYFISYKAEKADIELSGAKHAISLLGGKYEKMEQFYLPESDMKRNLVMIRKTLVTPNKYPRLAGKPNKEPL